PWISSNVAQRARQRSRTNLFVYQSVDVRAYANSDTSGVDAEQSMCRGCYPKRDYADGRGPTTQHHRASAKDVEGRVEVFSHIPRRAPATRTSDVSHSLLEHDPWKACSSLATNATPFVRGSP